MNILILGGSANQRMSLRSILNKEGFLNVKAAATVKAAASILGLNEIRSSSGLDLILLDIHLQDMSGTEACRIIKASEHLQDVPVIMISESANVQHLKLAFAVGARDYVIKPVQETELLARVRSCLTLKNEVDQRKANEYQLRQMASELHKSKQRAEEANEQIIQSLQYAKEIQHSLLPTTNDIKKHLPKSFVIWQPRDIVGGDIHYFEWFGDGFVAALIDCTGHGIPGAFLTMIASSALRRIIWDEGVRLPEMALKRLNMIIKTTLRQNTDTAISDHGLDAAICFVRLKNQSLLYAGAKLPLIYIKNNDIHMVKGDRQSIGYKESRRSSMSFEFTRHIIPLEKNMTFYMFSDGFSEQLGGPKQLPFGFRRLAALFKKASDMPFDEQKSLILKTFENYRGYHHRQDDMTVIGFGV